MSYSIAEVPDPVNEPILSYAPGTPEREELKKKLDELESKRIEIPIIIGGRKHKTGNMGECRAPHDHKHLLGTYHKVSKELVEKAIDTALKAREEWCCLPWEQRTAIFLKMADLLAGPHRQTVNAATMLCQDKNVYQAEIDAACELIDFFRFNAYFMQQLYEMQPISEGESWNRVEYRPLEGFVFAVTPFNFTSIAGNLPTSPALMGNVVIWKPARSVIYTAHFLVELFREAGVPEGVITMLPGSGSVISPPILNHPYFAGIHFTGGTATFQHLWRTISENLEKYNTYPRMVGETGGKDFVFAHPSADLDALATALLRGAFEYQGQKCSAASRAYVPKSKWPGLKRKLLKEIKTMKMGPPTDFSNFINAVIDKEAYQSIKKYITYAKRSKDADIIVGGNCSDKVGYFIEPTIIHAKKPKFRTMEEEIFGPVLTVYVYPDKEFEKYLKICDETSPYGLTGSIFAQDRHAIWKAQEVLRDAAGNFYINDKPTGAVVGQQPFGGARASGTNDKAGSLLNLIRWVSARTIKENLNPPKDYKYPFLEED
jgi:1-pyrroline-5-carboxylate dehydrogenase